MADNIGEVKPGGQPGAGGDNTPNNTNNGSPADKGVGGKPGEGQPGDKVFTYKEDRTDWLPRHRLNEESGKRTTAEKERDQYKQQLEAEQKRTRALAGVEEVDPKAKETAEIRAAIEEMFPHIKLFEGLTAEQLETIFEAAESAQNTSRASWERHALGILADVESGVAEGIGVDKLSPTQQRRVQSAYREEAAAAVNERQTALKRGERESVETISTDNDFVARHERGDKTLTAEFVKAFLADWFEPARKSVVASNARRIMRPVPRGERTRVPITQGKDKVDLTDNNAFKKALLEARASGQE